MSEFSVLPAAEAIWLQHLARQVGGESVDFERLCAAHPAMAPQFERLNSEWLHSTHAAIASQALDTRLGGVLERLAQLRPAAARYEDRGELGRGGMGVVRRVWDATLHRELALKTLHVRFGAAREQALARFVEEAQILAQLDHPSIVPVHELGLDERDQPYFVMKLVRGRSLGVVCALAREQREGWTQTRVVSVLLTVCQAVGHAHAKGVVHRDLKPANVMVGELGEVYVMDWGIARIVREGVRSPIETVRTEGGAGQRTDPLQTASGAVIGTAAYMSPEQARGESERLDARSDVYAVGAMLYELLAGRAPYSDSGRAMREVLAALLAGPPTALERLAPNAPSELVAICGRAMAHDAAQRYADLAELAAELGAYLEGRVVRAHRTGALVRAAKWVRRNRALSVALAAIVLIGAGSVVAQVYQAAIAAEREANLRGLAGQAALNRLEDEAATLWPPHPERIVDFARWQASADALFYGSGGGGSPRDGEPAVLAQFRQQLLELRNGRAVEHADSPASSQQRRALLEELATAREELLWRQRMIGAAPWPDERVVRDALTDLLAVDDPSRLLREGRQRLGGLLRRHGQEVEARLLAARALECATRDQERAAAHEQLATAHLKCGNWDLALDHARRSTEYDGKRDLVNLAEFELEVAAVRAPGETERRCEQVAVRVRALEHKMGLLSAPAYDSPTLAVLDDELAKLVLRMEQWLDPESGILGDNCTPTFGWGIARRLRQAERLSASLESTEGAELWRHAARAIRESAHYGGLHIVPQVGLWPLGPDPRTGLWEFAHLLSGEAPTRGAEGELVVTEEAAIVLVLLRGGECWIGAQSIDPTAPNYDAEADSLTPIHMVRLEPYFLSKYELTQAQWARMTAQWPIRAQGGDQAGRRPVAAVSWRSCAQVLQRYGLALPTEAQWEQASRAGSARIYSCDESDLGRHSNFYDESGERHWGYDDAIPEPWDDGNSEAAPVGAYLSNAFGLHDMHGNVAEWCADAFADYTSPTRAGDGLRETADPSVRILRGGSFATSASQGACAVRSSERAEAVLSDLGCRPARRLDTR